MYFNLLIRIPKRSILSATIINKNGSPVLPNRRWIEAFRSTEKGQQENIWPSPEKISMSSLRRPRVLPSPSYGVNKKSHTRIVIIWGHWQLLLLEVLRLELKSPLSVVTPRSCFFRKQGKKGNKDHFLIYSSNKPKTSLLLCSRLLEYRCISRFIFNF